MSYVAEAARETLRSAGAGVRQARRTLLLAAGVLALLHLLTVGPYVATSQRLAEIGEALRANQMLLAAVDPGVASLAEAGAEARQRLENTLRHATDRMIAQFRALQPLVADAREGRVPPLAAPAGSFSGQRQAQGQLQQQQVPIPQQMQQAMPQGPQMQMQQSQPQMPMQQGRPAGMHTATPNTPGIGYPDGQQAMAVGPALHAVLTAIAANSPDAYRMMTNYGREEIVQPAYERAQRAWDRRIRPVYSRSLAALIESARTAADRAPPVAAATAADLRAAADRLAEHRQAIATVELRHDAMVDESLDSDWWFTVEGKGAYADAVVRSIQEQLDAILGFASGVAGDIKQTLALQVRLQSEIEAEQGRLRDQFNAQRTQLTALSGFGGVLPVDLVSFIGLFPLVLGLVLGLLLLRAAEERRQAAQAADDLAAAADGDPEARRWLIRQALGTNGWPAAAAATLAIAVAATAWIWLAAEQVEAIAPPPVLHAQTSALMGAATVALAVLWDLAAVARLSRARQRS